METVDFQLDLTDITTDLSIEVENITPMIKEVEVIVPEYIEVDTKFRDRIQGKPFEVTEEDFGDLTEIPERTFYYSTIEKANIPNTIKKIGAYAFNSCKQLNETILREGLEVIGEQAFYVCKGMPFPKLPNTLTEVGNNGLGALKSYPNYLIIPPNLKTIGNNALADPSSEVATRCVVIPLTVETIGRQPFNDSGANIYCEATEKPSGWNSAWVDTADQVVWGIKDYGITDGLVWIAVNDSEVVIGRLAENKGLIDVVIPETINGYTVKSIDRYAFYDFYKNGTVEIESVILPDTITSIGAYAFCYCKKLKTAIISNNITEIQKNAFAYCDSLTSIEIPNSATSIGNYAFAYCHSLTSVTIPNSVTSIGSNAFYNCKNIKSVTIGSSVTTIGNYALNWSMDSGSKTIYTLLPTSPPTIQANTFYGSNYIDKIIVPKGCLEAYQTATNWSKYAGKMVEATE